MSQASEPQTTELGTRTPDLPPDQHACVSVPDAQAITLQVDMAVALERMDFAERYGQSYLCLLHSVFIAGRHPAARATRWPRLLTSLLLSQPAPSSARPAWRAHFVLPCPQRRHPGPHCVALPIPCSIPCSSGCCCAAGCASSPSGCRRPMRKCEQSGEHVSPVAGSGPLSFDFSVCLQRGGDGGLSSSKCASGKLEASFP